MRSRLRGTEALLQYLEGDFGVTLADLGFAPWTETVRLKDTAKHLIEYEDSQTTTQMRTGLEHLNVLLADTTITLDGGSTSGQDLSAKRLYRVFNDGSFDKGGRFYGGWWMSIPSDDRSRILIDGEVTTELDYSAIHCRLCYDLQGIPLPLDVDPYTIPGLEGLRSSVKVGFLTLINIGVGRRARASDEMAAALRGRMSFKAFLGTIERHHGDISGWFRSGKGVELQRLDSEIAKGVMGFMAFKAVPCLPVHDSFIVPSSMERELRHAMNETYAAKVRSPSDLPCYPVIG